ncbi:hypothetical protein LB553_09535 [Mesorhizobium sp. CA8]|uniref:hypothetical protein n=1 Tax=Mesorhizobium sp. CA8 TaxID=2876637 RepID=UPI001CC96439|nr:hypothetical protein [Mesorhizobium sp. CA8]MBZ9761116.1 hypothetical protein [Mesorhizobium sp. CA8]
MRRTLASPILAISSNSPSAILAEALSASIRTARRGDRGSDGVIGLSLALFMPPEVLAFNVNDLAAVRAFHLGVSTNPADKRLCLMAATGAFHVDFEVVRLALCHRHASAFVSGGLSRFLLLYG